MNRCHQSIVRIFLAGIAGVAGMAALPCRAQQKNTAPPPAEGRLAWWNGQSISGTLVDAGDDSLRWKSPLFDEPARLAFSELKAVTLPSEAKAPEETFSFTLADGSRIYGSLDTVDDGGVEIRSERHGRVRIDREAVVSVNRLTGGGVLWSGPFGDLGWTYAGKPAIGRQWHSGPGGSLVSQSLRQRVTLPWKLDKPIELAFQIRSSERPEFEVRLVGSDFSDFITTWDDEIVLRRGLQFIPLMTLKPNDRTVSLRFFWNPKDASGAVATPDGKVLARWQTRKPAPSGGPPPGPMAPGVEMLHEIRIQKQDDNKSTLPPEGVTWINRGKDLTIESLRLREWNGEMPVERATPEFNALPLIETTSGATIEGSLLRIEGTSLVARTNSPGAEESSIPLDDIMSIRYAADPKGKARQPARPPKVSTLVFADGTVLSGALSSLTGEKITLQTGFSPDPVESDATGLREVSWSGPPEKITPLAQLDKITTAGVTLHGTWRPAPDRRLQWILVGASEPVPLASSKSPVEITRATPADRKWPKAPVLFFLSDNQIAPGELVAIDREGDSITVRSDIIGVDRLDSSGIEAIQFSGPEIQPDGFTDPGWRYLRGKTGSDRLPGADQSSVALEAGQSFGHPSILAGDEIQFDLLASGYGTVRLRLFTDGTERDSPSTRLLIAHYGNEVYCGIEESEGNFDNQSQTPVEQNKPVRIRITWTAGQIQTFINGTPAFKANVKTVGNNNGNAPADPFAGNRNLLAIGGGGQGSATARSGRGLVFEPANLWGNGERPVTVSNFSVRISPGYTNSPPVPAKARAQALFLPRFRKEDAPRHILIAHTGDLLRGSIEAATADRIAFRTGLESLTIPRDRAAAAIWLKPPPKPEAAESIDPAARKESAEPAPSLPDAFGLPPQTSHWLILRSGARLGLAVESFGPDAVTGHSESLGTCRVPIDHIHLIRTTEPPRDRTSTALSGWQLVSAPEPDPEGATGGSASSLLGKPAPPIDLPLLAGGEFKLSAEKGNVVILDFWATWCGPCVRALPEMMEAFSALNPKRVKFIAVNQAESPEIIRRFLDQRDWTGLAVALDASQKAGRAYGVEGIPHTVVVGPDGKVAKVATGFRPGAAAEIAELVQGLLDPKPAG